MYKFMLIVLSVFCLGLLLVGCEAVSQVDETDDYILVSDGPESWGYDQLQNTIKSMTKLDLFGEHTLDSFGNSSSQNASFSGIMFLGGGYIDGKTNSAREVTFNWRSKREGVQFVTFSSLPANKVRRIIDNKAIKPVIVFKWQIADINKDLAGIQKDNPAEFIKPRYIAYATVKAQEKNIGILIGNAPNAETLSSSDR